MTDIAKYMRIFDIDPSDDLVTKRTAALKIIVDGYKKITTINSILELGNSLSAGISDISSLNRGIIEKIESAIKKDSLAFIAEGQELQVLTFSLIAALQYIESTSSAKTKLTVPDVLAIAMWSSLSFKAPLIGKEKLEDLRLEIIRASSLLVSSDAISSRDRLVVPSLKTVPTPNDITFEQLATAFQKTVSSYIEPLITNATLDREEINLLWWVLNDWSEIANKPVSELSDPEKALIAGIELSQILRRLPSSSHMHLAMRGVNRTLSYTSAEFLVAVESILPKIKEYLSDIQLVEKNANVFPLFTILRTSSLDGDGCAIKRSIEEWCNRALLEGAIINLSEIIKDSN